ncbi:MAG: hypothetical protein VX772_04235 [Bacteroidota bacterium]|uniref:Secreted protein n=1 Tax=Flagellimonas okinawensis TaxID=3031324 RepID=A0ABT5XN55_9FLAO|nr:hypothetical protein [[Muricauda] okinawensis]MDF0707326.1 hypothetical protein [[Muricauda] okinawensis]MEC8831544.1 hypothetical protein [Bacteroidota bacterium]
MKRKLKLLFLAITAVFLVALILKEPKSSIPKSIEEEAHIALQYFPSLQDIPIEFKFKKNIEKSVMQAQPTWSGLLKSKSKRSYVILISEKFKISGKEFKTLDVPKDVLIGWIGHELGHVMDYQERGNLNLIGFGIRYVLLKEFVKKAERAADSFAVSAGMSNYILTTKRFILNHSEIDKTYKNRIKQYYLSPDEIMEMVEQQDSIKDKD